jgi:malate dehydrogenase (oxaloacetate-decarboxylating)
MDCKNSSFIITIKSQNMDYFEESLKLHRKHRGKIKVMPKLPAKTKDDLSLAYSPGVAAPCQAIYENPETVYDYTIKGNTVAIVSDGSAVLGLGNIGAKAAIPVMEGKAMLFKHFAGLDAFPICVETQDTEQIIQLVKNIAPVFGGVNLEDISAPRCFEIENRLQDIGIPVFHDDQHGTAVVTLAGLLNACKVVHKKMSDLTVVVNGSGAAGGAIARLLSGFGNDDPDFVPVKSVMMCDTKGIIHQGRTDLTAIKKEFLSFTNLENRQGNLFDAMRGADVFVGVSVANLLTAKDIQLMNPNSIIFALANPVPEIMPEEAYKGGAAVVGTGRSDLPNQVNNVLGYPGIFKGALEARAKRITLKMKVAAAYAIAGCVKNPNRDMIIPSPLNKKVVKAVAAAVKAAV